MRVAPIASRAGLVLVMLALVTAAPQPGRAQELPTPTPKACHACDEGLPEGVVTPQPVVRVVLFWMDGCSYCHDVLEGVIPPLQREFGQALEIHLVEVETAEDVDRLYQVAASYHIPAGGVGVPFLIVGEHVLIGSGQIPAELPGLIRKYLAAGGVDYPQTPSLAGLVPTPVQSAASCQPQAGCAPDAAEPPVVHLLVLWTSDCVACLIVLDEVLPPLQEEYGAQLVAGYVDIVSGADVDRFYRFAGALGVPQDQAHLPMVVVGDQVLIGAEQIPSELPGLVQRYLGEGGIGPPSTDMFTVEAEPTLPSGAGVAPPGGISVAVGAMAAMVGALVFSGRTIWRTVSRRRASPGSPAWAEVATPLLAAIGLGVAGYLAYVEITAVPAVCGPVGDCNAVHTSAYARLFGVLPVGVLGLIGYLAILGAWTWSRIRRDRLARAALPGILGMTLFGVLFSLYLTALEAFVIRAVCMWCVTSAVVMTLLLLLSLGPALSSRIGSRDGQPEPS